MTNPTPHDDVQQELEGLSPLLARLRDTQPKAIDMDMLHALGGKALQAVPLKEQVTSSVDSTLRVVHRTRKRTAVIAAAVAICLGALLSYSIYGTFETATAGFADSNSALSAELIASYEEQTADPIAFLLDDEFLYADEEDLFFSPAEDVLLDWAEDGDVEDILSEEVMIDAIR